MRFLTNLWRLLRPHHWVKNAFVFSGILFANAWRQPGTFVKVILAAVAFSLIASGVYASNDLSDREEDRNHPKKKHRPVASGAISGVSAMVIAVLLWSAGVAVGYSVSLRVMVVLLDKMIVITATGVILTYSLYTMSPVTIQVHHTEALIYTVPFVMYGIFRYIFLLHHRATGADPTLEVFRDPHILFSILGWLFVTLWLIAR